MFLGQLCFFSVTGPLHSSESWVRVLFINQMKNGQSQESVYLTRAPQLLSASEIQDLPPHFGE
jgi:hypothetical protein